MAVDGAEGYLRAVVAAVDARLPEELARRHTLNPKSVPIFDRMLQGNAAGDEQTHAIHAAEGLPAAAFHVLQRGNEVLKDVANSQTHEFRMAMASQKFGERARQMYSVLRAVFGASGAQSLAESSASQRTRGAEAAHCDVSQVQGSEAETAARHACSTGISRRPDPTAPAFSVLSLGGGSGNDAAGAIAFLLERRASHGSGTASIAVPTDTFQSKTRKLTWAEKKAAKRAGRAGSAVSTTSPASSAHHDPTDASGVDGADSASGDQTGTDRKEANEFLFAGERLRRTAVAAPATATLKGCPAVRCHILDIDREWRSSVGAIVDAATRAYFSSLASLDLAQSPQVTPVEVGSDGCGAAKQDAIEVHDAEPFATMQWHVCDVTQPLCPVYGPVRPGTPVDTRPPTNAPPSHPPNDPVNNAGEPGRGSDCSGCVDTDGVSGEKGGGRPVVGVRPQNMGLILTSYLFTIHPGLPEGHTGRLAPGTAAVHVPGELSVSKEFWSALVAANPDAWFVFVEGWVSKKTWLALFDVFEAFGRVLSIPQRVAGELPQRSVIPSKRRPHPIREKPRSYCYWFSPPAGAQ